MPRSLRIEYPGAVYHVLNRGNYRYDLFVVDGSKEAFEETLFKACENGLGGFSMRIACSITITIWPWKRLTQICP